MAKRPTGRGQLPAGAVHGIVHDLHTLAIPIESIKADEGNPYDHPDEQVERIRASLEVHGQREPLTANRVGEKLVLTSGHGRLTAMRSLGWTHVAVVVVEEPESRAKAWSLAANETTKGRKRNDEKARERLKSMSAIDRAATAMKRADLEALLADKPSPDDEDEKPPKGKTKIKATTICPHCQKEIER